MDIKKLAYNEGPSIYYDPKFRAVLEDHMSFLRMHDETIMIQLNAHEVHKWVGDLFGFLLTLNIPAHMHWVVMRINSLSTPTDLNDSISNLLIPSSKALQVIANLHNTRSKISF